MAWHPLGLGDVICHQHPDSCFWAVMAGFAAQNLAAVQWWWWGGCFLPLPLCLPVLWLLECTGVPGMAALDLAAMSSRAATLAPEFFGSMQL